MDFLDPKKKRAHKIRLYLGYSLMTVALGIATLILVFAAYGYDIDRATGGVIQNGLVILDAHPESATIFINGENKGSTDSRLVLPANKYAIELTRNGYLPWKHNINLEGSSIEQLVYPFLYPEKLTSKSLQTYSAVPSMASESPDRKWLVVALADSPGAFGIVDLGDTKNPTSTINLPTDTFTAVAGVHSFEAVEWSTDNVHLLVKHDFVGGSEFIVINRENPVASVNLNKLFAPQVFSTITLRDKKADQFYMYNITDGSLFSADAKAKAVTLIQSKVLAYKTYEANTVLYVTNPTDDETSEVHVRIKDQDQLLRSLPKATNYLLDMAKFNGSFYMVSGSIEDGRTYIYKNPIDDFNHKPTRTPQPFRVLITPNAQYVSFSSIARFVAVQGGSNFAVYDIETGRQFRYDTKLPLAPNQKATWMDGHRLLLNSQNSVQVFDFDGTNLHKLSNSIPSFKPFFDRDYTALFTLALDSGDPSKTSLLRTDLKILPK